NGAVADQRNGCCVIGDDLPQPVEAVGLDVYGVTAPGGSDLYSRHDCALCCCSMETSTRTIWVAGALPVSRVKSARLSYMGSRCCSNSRMRVRGSAVFSKGRLRSRARRRNSSSAVARKYTTTPRSLR